MLNPLLAEYHEYFASSAPYEQLTLGGISNVLAEQSAWQKAVGAGQVSGYIEGSQVTINNSGAAAVNTPLTGVTGVGSSYGGITSGWTSVPAGASTHTAPVAWPAATAITKIEPASGPPAGGSAVTITGEHFTGATAVRFGTTSATTFEVHSENSISAVSPAGSGTVCVTVTTSIGTSAETAGCLFTYVAPPTIQACTVSVTQSTASLCALVNPNGGTVSECKFEYGTTPSYGKTAPCGSLPGSGESSVAVSASISGLTANTTYHFKISATNAGGTSQGADETFKTVASCTPEGFCIAFTNTESHEAPFGEPNAVAVDPSGNIWVADSAHDHLLEFNSSREFVRQIGSEGSEEGQFKGIGGLATNSSGDIYVSDTGNDRIQEFSSTGTHLATFGSWVPGSGQLLSPGAIAIDESGNVWVLNGKEAQEGGRIVEFSSSGTFVSQFGSKGTAGGQLLYADGLAFSGGNLYVSEVSPHRVQELSTSGAFIAAFDEAGSLPSGIATDPSTGNLYVQT